MRDDIKLDKRFQNNVIMKENNVHLFVYIESILMVLGLKTICMCHHAKISVC